MTLSLDDVRNKRFRMARKGGYEVLEVDEFVDEVEESFAQLVEENASLKKQVGALRSSSDPVGEPTATAPEPVTTEEPAQAAGTGRQAEPGAPVEPGTTAEPVQVAHTPQAQPVVVTTSAEASTAVVRLVQLSTEQAEHLVREAHEEAAQIRQDASRNAQQLTEDARTRAERLESEARVNAERVQAEAQNRSESLEHELVQRRTQLFGDLDRQRDTLTETVARLRDFEQKYRSSLHEHLSGQLSTLEHVGLEPDGGPERTAPREPSMAAVAQAQPSGDASNGGGQVPAEHSNGAGPAQGTGSSDTPRLDALLGEQR